MQATWLGNWSFYRLTSLSTQFFPFVSEVFGATLFRGFPTETFFPQSYAPNNQDPARNRTSSHGDQLQPRNGLHGLRWERSALLRGRYLEMDLWAARWEPCFVRPRNWRWKPFWRFATSSSQPALLCLLVDRRLPGKSFPFTGVLSSDAAIRCAIEGFRCRCEYSFNLCQNLFHLIM